MRGYQILDWNQVVKKMPSRGDLGILIPLILES